MLRSLTTHLLIQALFYEGEEHVPIPNCQSIFYSLDAVVIPKDLLPLCASLGRVLEPFNLHTI